MSEAAESGDKVAFVKASFDFHLEVVKLARHERLTAIYKSLYMQMQLCMAMSVHTREERLGSRLRRM